MSRQRIPLDELRVGMYVAKLDLSWFRSPFMRHSLLIEDPVQIEKLRRAGVQSVEIDPARGPQQPAQSVALDRLSDQHQPVVAAPSNGEPKSLARLSEEYNQALLARTQLERSVRSVYAAINQTGTIGTEPVQEAVQEILIAARTLTNAALFMALSQHRGGDASLSQHALTTCTLSLVLGQTYGYNPLVLHEMATAALLHDIGLLKIPEAIIRRCATTSSPLSERDRQQFQSHPRLGVTMLERQPGFDASVLHVIGEHHALLDGSGYPPETRGEFTSDQARILVIVDRYDELITGFGGATPLAPHQALQRLYREAHEGKLDRDILSRFIKTVGIYPVHSCVRLNTKELAVVTDLNAARLHQPIVTVTHEPGGSHYPAPFVVNLAHQEGHPPERAIDAVLDHAPLSRETASHAV